MSYDPHKDVRELFPIFDDIEKAVHHLNDLLHEADKQSLSIRFTQGDQYFTAPNGAKVRGPVEPKLNMTTLSWKRPDDKTG